MTKTTSSTVSLPEDLIVEILSRVPAVSLVRLRSTSKGWNTLIKDKRFAKKHSAYAPPRHYPLVIMLIDFRVHLVSVDPLIPSAKATCQVSLKDPSSLEVDIRDIFHCDGLLLCTTKDNRLVVWNPCSCETRWIQPRTWYKKYDNYALGYDNKSSCYKILRMNQIRHEYQVYDFISHSWRVIGYQVTENVFVTYTGSRGRVLSVKGNAYWFGPSINGQPKLLLSFDFSTDEFRSLPLPQNGRGYYHSYLTVTREGQQLCMFATKYDICRQLQFQTNVWIATKIESTGDLSWSKFSNHFHLKIEMNVLNAKKVLMCRYLRGLDRCDKVLHFLGEDIYIQVNERREPLLTYIPSLVQIQQGV